MSRKDLNLREFDISCNEYRKILYHCRDYDRKKRELRECYTMSRHGQTVGRGSDPSDPVAMAVIRAERLKRYVETIDRCAALAGGDVLARFIVWNVSRGISYEQMHAREHVPCGKRQFYEVRRKFFFLMSREI